MRSASFPFSWTNTASTTTPGGLLTGGAAARLRIYDMIYGAEGAADNVVRLALQRSSARGTASTSYTPVLNDEGEAALIALCDTAWSVLPTLRANAWGGWFPHNERASMRWVATAPDHEIVVQATAGAGLAVMATVNVGAAFAETVTLSWKE